MTEDLSEQQLQGLVGRAEVERETGFEPATFCLGNRNATVQHHLLECPKR
jgi:hypothetical protein